MDNGTDLSKIVDLIMKNPEIIERIKDLKNESEAMTNKANESARDDNDIHKGQISSKRCALLSALKPYLSPKRGKAIETMLSAIEVLDLIKGG
jgi:hypothetical protein